MAKALTCNIVIENKQAGSKPYIFYYVNHVMVIDTWKDISMRAYITQARSRVKIGAKNFQHFLPVQGSPVYIEVGYNGNNRKVYEGWISDVKPGRPINVECEDWAYWAKRTTINQIWQNKSLPDILADLVAAINKQAAKLGVKKIDAKGNLTTAELTLSPNVRSQLSKNIAASVIYDQVSAYEALENLKQTYNMACYFRDNELNFGAAYLLDPAKFNGKEIILEANSDRANVIRQQMQFNDPNTSPIRIHAKTYVKGTGSARTLLEAFFGPVDGGIRTILVEKAKTLPELKEAAKREYERINFQGWKGTLQCFGIPFIQPNNTVDLFDGDYADVGLIGDEKGVPYLGAPRKYVVDGVVREWGLGGYKQNIEMGPALTSIKQ